MHRKYEVPIFTKLSYEDYKNLSKPFPTGLLVMTKPLVLSSFVFFVLIALLLVYGCSKAPVVEPALVPAPSPVVMASAPVVAPAPTPDVVVVAQPDHKAVEAPKPVQKVATPQPKAPEVKKVAKKGSNAASGNGRIGHSPTLAKSAKAEKQAFAKAKMNGMRATCLRWIVDKKIDHDVDINQIRDIGNVIPAPVCAAYKSK